MIKYNNIEFFTSPEGEILIRIDGEQIRELTEADELVVYFFEKVRKDYPEAFSTLSEIYKASERNLSYFRYLCVRRFIRCNFSMYDTLKYDIDCDGQFHFEQIKCPIGGECIGFKRICNPKFNNSLSNRENQILKLYGLENMEIAEIASLLFISPFTVETTIRTIRLKLNIHNKAGLAHYCENHFK